MAATYNDGTVQYGSRSWWILQNNGTSKRGTVVYVCDNITINRPTKAVDRTDQIGEPSGSVGIADFVTGSCTVQLIDADQPEPVAGDRIFCTAATVDDANGYNVHLIGTTDEKFFITSVTRAEGKDAEVKVTLNFKKQYGA